jgi:hypothetical protein
VVFFIAHLLGGSGAQRHGFCGMPNVMQKYCLWRWLTVAIATLSWGFPLSVLSDLLGFGALLGWAVGVVGVLLADLFCFIWWLGLVASHERESGTLHDRLASRSTSPDPSGERVAARQRHSEGPSEGPSEWH